MKKGMQMRKKRPRKSVPQTPILSLGQTLQVVEDEFQAALSRCDKDINIDFMITLNRLVWIGFVTDRDRLLRTSKESFKQSWDCGMSLPICHQDMFSGCPDYNKAMQEEVEAYVNYAASSGYFEVGDPKKRMDLMTDGIFTIYPDPQPQTDPIFGKQRNLYKVVPLISLLAAAAVEYHNFMTGSKLHLKDVIKANLFFVDLGQYYFITLKAAFDNGEEVTCQSRVLCHVDGNNGWPRMPQGPMPIRRTFVESFRIVSTPRHAFPPCPFLQLCLPA